MMILRTIKHFKLIEIISNDITNHSCPSRC